MSLSELPYTDRRAPLAPEVRARMEAVDESTHTAIALLLGTGLASPVLIAALTGRQDVLVALGLYLVALVAAWIAIGVFVGAFSLAGRSDTVTDDEAEREHELDPHRARPIEAAEAAARDADEEPDPAPATR